MFMLTRLPMKMATDLGTKFKVKLLGHFHGSRIDDILIIPIIHQTRTS